jgi:hypothetical protein
MIKLTYPSKKIIQKVKALAHKRFNFVISFANEKDACLIKQAEVF